MSKPAGRGLDFDVCPQHFTGIQSPDPKNAHVNGRDLVYGGSRIACPGCADFVVTGSGTVKLGGKPVARQLDRTMHGGAIRVGSGNVNVGGPTVGVRLGFAEDGNKACHALKASREGHAGARDYQQSWGNCGIESARMIVNHVNGTAVTEKQAFAKALEIGATPYTESGTGYVDYAKTHEDENGHVVVDSIERSHLGPEGGGSPNLGDTPEGGEATIMNAYGVPSTTMTQSMDNIIPAVAEGKGVVTWNEVQQLWRDEDGNDSKERGGHAVNVTGIQYGADGKVVGVMTADTGVPPGGNCCRFVKLKDFEDSFHTDHGKPVQISVTKDPVWR